jgi:hypothetical protein
MRAKLKYSLKQFKNGQFRHHEIDTGAYVPHYTVDPTRDGYTYNELGYELISAVREDYEQQFADEATDLVDEMFSKLKADLEALRNSYEAKMAKAVVARKSKQLEAAE